MISKKVLISVALLGLMTASARFGLPIVSLSLRLLLPIAAAYLIYRFVRNKLLPTSQPVAESRYRHDPDLIEICPKCGEVAGDGHRCASRPNNAKHT